MGRVECTSTAGQVGLKKKGGVESDSEVLQHNIQVKKCYERFFFF